MKEIYVMRRDPLGMRVSESVMCLDWAADAREESAVERLENEGQVGYHGQADQVAWSDQ